jgi:hypothetical protein
VGLVVAGGVEGQGAEELHLTRFGGHLIVGFGLQEGVIDGSSKQVPAEAM